MKGRESGMPEKEVWEGFFNPAETLRLMGLDNHVNDVAEFGCGYGVIAIRGILLFIPHFPSSILKLASLKERPFFIVSTMSKNIRS